MTNEQLVQELLAKRDELYRELVNCSPIKLGTEWYTDRTREMEYVNRQLVRLGAIPASV